MSDEANAPDHGLPVETLLADVPIVADPAISGAADSRMPELGFNDGKAADALRTIGEVTRALGIRQHVLRYWEEQFPMLRPVKRSGNRRYYRPEDIALIAEIDRLVHHEGFTLRGARLAIEAGKGKVVAPAEEPIPSVTSLPTDMDAERQSASLRDELRAIRAELASALAQA